MKKKKLKSNHKKVPKQKELTQKTDLKQLRKSKKKNSKTQILP